MTEPTDREEARYRLAVALSEADDDMTDAHVNAMTQAVDELIEAHFAEPHGDVRDPQGHPAPFVGGRTEPGPATASVDTRSSYPHGSACANGHDWQQATRKAGMAGVGRVWCDRCNRYPEQVADVLQRKLDEADTDRLRWATGLREILRGRPDEDLPAVARRVMADLDFAQRSANAEGIAARLRFQYENGVAHGREDLEAVRAERDAAVAARDRTGRAFAGLAANLNGLTKAHQDVVAERDANKAGWDAAVADLYVAKKELLAQTEALLALMTRVASIYGLDVSKPTGCTNASHKQPCEFGCGK